MQFVTLNKLIAVSGQIQPADLPAIKAAGFASILCNRPDAESEDQAPFAVIAEAAQNLGLYCVHQPVASGQVSLVDAADFVDQVAKLPKPVLAYCRTGTRCITLWALAEMTHTPKQAVLEQCEQLGYCIEPAIEAALPRKTW